MASMLYCSMQSYVAKQQCSIHTVQKWRHSRVLILSVLSAPHIVNSVSAEIKLHSKEFIDVAGSVNVMESSQIFSF